MQNLTLVKIGGNITDNSQALDNFLQNFSKIEGKKILVHGGGKTATKLAEKLNVPTQMLNGRRITNSEMLDVAVMVYAGLTNKNIVAKLQKNHILALGLTGADLNLILSHKRITENIDYGFVGDVEKVDAAKISQLLQLDFVPVFCAITHDQNGQLLNTNADTIASEIAVSLAEFFEVKLIYGFEKRGVLLDVNDENSLIEKINPAEYERLVKEQKIHSGMLPKLDNAFAALRAGVKQVWISQAENVGKNLVGTCLEL